MSAHSNVKRIDTGHTHGWQVHAQRNGELHTKLFSDKKCGSREEALEKALAYRDELLKELPEIPRSPGHLHTSEMRHRAWKQLTQTGVMGIGLTWQSSSGGKYPYVQAMWKDPDGTPRARARSISLYGPESALEQVCRLLYEGRRETGPDPEILYEQALPAVERFLEYPPKEAA